MRRRLLLSERRRMRRRLTRLLNDFEFGKRYSFASTDKLAQIPQQALIEWDYPLEDLHDA